MRSRPDGNYRYCAGFSDLARCPCFFRCKAAFMALNRPSAAPTIWSLLGEEPTCRGRRSNNARDPKRTPHAQFSCDAQQQSSKADKTIGL
jgi:hypothetical protein